MRKQVGIVSSFSAVGKKYLEGDEMIPKIRPKRKSKNKTESWIDWEYIGQKISVKSYN